MNSNGNSNNKDNIMYSWQMLLLAQGWLNNGDKQKADAVTKQALEILVTPESGVYAKYDEYIEKRQEINFNDNEKLEKLYLEYNDYLVLFHILNLIDKNNT